MTTVAVTGVGGLLGRALVARLADEPSGVNRMLGLDVKAVDLPPSDTVDIDVQTVDIRDAALVGLLDGVDVVIHLAFQMDPLRDVDLMRSLNVDGTMNVLAAARAAGVERVIYLSSVVAYGAHPDNDVPLTEASALRGTPGFSYAEHKREVEELLWLWHAAGDGPAVTVLRSAAVFGPGVENFLTRILELPLLPDLADAPPLQFVHIDDVVGAIVHALTTPIDGAFNVAPDGSLTYAQVLALAGRRTLTMDHARLEELVTRAHRLGIGELEPGVVDLFRYPWVLANDRLRATGWQPTRSNEETLLETVLDHARFVSVGRLRTSRTVLRTAGFAAAIAGAAAVAAVLRRR